MSFTYEALRSVSSVEERELIVGSVTVLAIEENTITIESPTLPEQKIILNKIPQFLEAGKSIEISAHLDIPAHPFFPSLVAIPTYYANIGIEEIQIQNNLHFPKNEGGYLRKFAEFVRNTVSLNNLVWRQNQ